MAEEQSPYAPPKAELTGSEVLQDSETWTYPLAYKGTLGFRPRHELRDVQQRLLWLATLRPIQAGLSIQTKSEGVEGTLEARLSSAWKQRWTFRDSETKELSATLTRLGGCFPGAFSLWPAWVAEQADARVVIRARGPALGPWVPGIQPQAPLAKTGGQDPDGLGMEDAAAHERAARATVHASEGAPAFLRVRHVRSAFERNFLFERLEGEVDAKTERLGHQALFLLLGMGLS